MAFRNGKAVDPWPLLDQNRKRYGALNARSGINVRGFPGREKPRNRMGYLYASAKDGKLIRARDGYDLGGAQALRRFGGYVKGAFHGIEPYPREWGKLHIGGSYRYVARPLMHLVRP
jgi:hypothetical protein